MTTFSNRQKLAAVLNKWAQPALQQVTTGRLDSLPFITALNNKLKSTGWVSSKWSLGKELSPLLSNVSGTIVEPLIMQYLQGIPDEALPQMAHSIVDNAITQGNLSLMEGNVVFELEDLKELKKYLEYNLPLDGITSYEVITTPPLQSSENESVISPTQGIGD